MVVQTRSMTKNLKTLCKNCIVRLIINPSLDEKSSAPQTPEREKLSVREIKLDDNSSSTQTSQLPPSFERKLPVCEIERCTNIEIRPIENKMTRFLKIWQIIQNVLGAVGGIYALYRIVEQLARDEEQVEIVGVVRRL